MNMKLQMYFVLQQLNTKVLRAGTQKNSRWLRSASYQGQLLKTSHKLILNHIRKTDILSTGRREPYVASVVGAGEQLAGSHVGDTVESSGLLAAAARRPLQHVHQVGDEEVVLQRRHALLRQDGGLAAHGAGKREAVGRDVIVQAPEGRGKRSGSAAAA